MNEFIKSVCWTDACCLKLILLNMKYFIYFSQQSCLLKFISWQAMYSVRGGGGGGETKERTLL